MGIAPFFERVYGAVSGHLSVSRESLESVLQQTTIGIRLTDLRDGNAWWIADLTTNLVARLYSRVAISADEPQRSRLQELAAAINPRIEFLDDAPPLTSIWIGKKPCDGALFPTATGWVARLGHSTPPQSGAANPYAAAASAALACAELFRRVFAKADAEEDSAVSLLDFGSDKGAQREIDGQDLGAVWFAGVGAIGNAALWVLARDKRLSGKLWLIDDEEITLLNLQRYVLASFRDVGTSKVELGRGALSAGSLTVDSAKMPLEIFADTHAPGIETICISVDNIDGRRSAQALLPRLVVNGWTGDPAAGVSWHRLSDSNACLACLYHPRGQGPSATEQAARALGLSPERAAALWVTRQPMSEDDLQSAATALGIPDSAIAPWRGKPLGELYTDVVCGAVPLDVRGVGRVETVPLAHQSALAGILLAAELVKRTSPQLAAISQVEPLVSWDDILRPPPAIWTKPRSREPGCICGDPDYINSYRDKWERGSQFSP